MNSFDNMKQLEDEMCSTIKVLLTSAIKKNGSAKILLSGGGTPKGLYNKLSHLKLNWRNIEIGLVDERFVDAKSLSSNERMIRETLLINEAKNASFTGMVFDPLDYQNNLNIAKINYQKFVGSDVLILGMGDDGHTASIFPNDKASVRAIDDSKASLINTNAPSDPKLRITLSKSFITTCKHVYLMFSGDEKKSVFMSSELKNYPISNFKEKLEMVYFAKN